jgi:hypothetical protein
MEQSNLLEQVRNVRSGRGLLKFLGARAGGDWHEREAAYERAKEGLRELRKQGLRIDAEVRAGYARLVAIKLAIIETERAKGEHFRATSDWTPDRIVERGQFSARLEQLLVERRQALAEIALKKQQRLAMERSESAVSLRADIDRIEIAAETERLTLVRNAILTTSGLPHTEHRPTAWHVPMVDPSGRWFDNIASTTEVYLEPLLSN